MGGGLGDHRLKKTFKKIVFLVPFFTTMEVVAPLENDPILMGRSIWSFRHLELQNPSTGYDFIHISPPWRWWRHLKMILSYRACRYSHLDTLNSKIHLLVMISSIFFQKIPP